VGSWDLSKPSFGNYLNLISTKWGRGGGKFILRVPLMMEKIGKWIFPLKSGFGIGPKPKY
jgi:hypothetical protein